MSAQFIAFLLDKFISLLGAVIATLIGYRKIGPKSGVNERFDSLYGKWLKHFKWIGPLSLAIVVLQTLFLYQEKKSSLMEDSAKSNQEQIETIRSNVTKEGNLAEVDTPIVSGSGFSVIAPKGYTYSKPDHDLIEVVAIKDINGVSTPAYTVVKSGSTKGMKNYIETIKVELSKKNETTKFSDTQIVDKGGYTLYRVFITTQREGGLVKGGMLFVERKGYVFMLTYGTHESLFAENEADFEKIAQSFAPV